MSAHGRKVGVYCMCLMVLGVSKHHSLHSFPSVGQERAQLEHVRKIHECVSHLFKLGFIRLVPAGRLGLADAVLPLGRLKS